jgi:hypothetical protein
VAGYRIYYLDEDDHVVMRGEYEAATDADALAQARQMFANSAHYSDYEVWNEDRLVPKTDTAGRPG